MDQAQGDLVAALNTKLAARGIRLEFTGDGLWVSARSADEDRAFDRDYGDMIRQLRVILKGEPAPVEDVTSQSDSGATTDPQLDPAVEQFSKFVDGIREEQERMGGGPPREVPVAKAEIAKPESTPGRPRLPLPPRSDSGIAYLDGRGLSWRARRDQARQRGEPFSEKPPYDMRVFGDSNEP
jgi:hypothetical protein